MRFDEVSARYGEFGSFFVGNRLAKEQLPAFCMCNDKSSKGRGLWSFCYLLAVARLCRRSRPFCTSIEDSA